MLELNLNRQFVCLFISNTTYVLNRSLYACVCYPLSVSLCVLVTVMWIILQKVFNGCTYVLCDENVSGQYENNLG